MKNTHALAILALLAIYLIWGTTYFAVRIAVDTLPPFLMIGTRYLAAGAILYLIVRVSGTRKPKLQDWKNASVIGISVMGFCNGVVALVAPNVNSGMIACIFAIGPFVLSIVAWLIKADKRPSSFTFACMIVGFIGVAILVGFKSPGSLSNHWTSTGMLLLATLSWAYGTAVSKKKKNADTPVVLLASLQMIWGGSINMIIGIFRGDIPAVDMHSISTASMLAFLYLVVFGTIIAFVSYNYLLETVSLTLIGTHAYVNPVVALIAGYFFLNEHLSTLQLLGVSMILATVFSTLLPSWSKDSSSFLSIIKKIRTYLSPCPDRGMIRTDHTPAQTSIRAILFQ